MLENTDYQTIIHEIKNSVTLLNSSLQLIEKTHPEIKNLEYWHTSTHEMNYLVSLIREISQSCPSEALQIKPINPTDLITNALKSFCSITSETDFQIDIHLEPDLSMILADPLRLKLAFTNLLKNAFEASGPNGKIWVEATQLNKKYVSIAISDNGPGLPPEIAAHIFEPFYTTKSNGTGLGLPITKQIIDGHNGSLDISASAEGGCKFTILIPTA